MFIYLMLIIAQVKFLISYRKKYFLYQNLYFYLYNYLYCIGSAMIMFEGYMGRILHTGDMRFN